MRVRKGYSKSINRLLDTVGGTTPDSFTIEDYFDYCESDVPIFGDNMIPRKVVVSKSGIIYSSMSLAARRYKISQAHLSNMLNGVLPNTTDLTLK
jgi:hypothetical protein